MESIYLASIFLCCNTLAFSLIEKISIFDFLSLQLLPEKDLLTMLHFLFTCAVIGCCGHVAWCGVGCDATGLLLRFRVTNVDFLVDLY